ncbi:MAG: diguanylate cyclase [Deltaproteobacteria bacterium]|nr:MAG: diguanylate cyclase [Deltaproteobacteria bacterium]
MATILIVDDALRDRVELRKVLARAGLFDRIVEAGDADQGLRRLHEEAIDVVLCGLEIPDLDADKLFRAKDSSPGGSTTAFVFLTRSAGPDFRALLLEAGAADAIDKPYHPAELVARLRLHLTVKWLRDELLNKNQALERLSTVDELTGLRNRRFLMEALSTEFKRARRFRTPLTLLMLDIDHFKQVNDKLGHQAGDEVLKGVAKLLQGQTRATDVVGRYGGEEIMVVLTQTGIGGARAYGEICRRAVESTPFDISDGDPVHITISVGVAAYNHRTKVPGDLVSNVDEALYRAKRNGRNRVEG